VYKLLGRYEDSRRDLESAEALAPDAQAAADLAYVDTLLKPAPAIQHDSQPQTVVRHRLFVAVTSPAQLEPMKRFAAQLQRAPLRRSGFLRRPGSARL
jgi:hypothetical protein